MKAFFFLLVILLLGCRPVVPPPSSPPLPGPRAAPTGGDNVSNGGGLGDKNFIYAFYALSGNIQDCLQSSLCQVTPADFRVLQKISEALDTRVEVVENLIFKSESKEPGFFWLNGQPKTALTGSKPGDPIYINLDHLYSRGHDGLLRPITVIESTALLIHELAHHQGIGSRGPELQRLESMTSRLTKFFGEKLSGALEKSRAAWNTGTGMLPVLQCESSHQNTLVKWAEISLLVSAATPEYYVSYGQDLNLRANRIRERVRISRQVYQVDIATVSGGRDGFRLALVLPQVNLLQPKDPFAEGIVGEGVTTIKIPSIAAQFTEGERTFRWHCQVDAAFFERRAPLSVLFLR